MLISSNNRLLQRAEVGAGKPSTFALPPPAHAYGFKPRGTDSCVGECLHPSTGVPCPPEERLIMAKPNECRPEEGKGDPRVFGIKNRPSTPFKEVVNFKYGNDSVQGLTIKYQKYNEQKNVKKVLKHKNTASNVLKMTANKEYIERTFKPEAKEPFKMERFKSVESKVKKMR